MRPRLSLCGESGHGAPAMLRILVLAACLAGGVSYTVPTSRQVAARRATMLFPRALSPTASITGLDKGEPEVDIMEVPLLPCPPSTSRHGPCVPLRPGPAPEDALHHRVGAGSRPQPCAPPLCVCEGERADSGCFSHVLFILALCSHSACSRQADDPPR